MNLFLKLLRFFTRPEIREIWFNAKFEEKAIVIWEYNSWNCWVWRHEGKTIQHPSSLESLVRNGWVRQVPKATVG